MPTDIELQITSEINKTGFPLELRASDFLRSQGYLVNHSVYYVDNDEGKGRELDILAHKFWRQEKGNLPWFADNFLAIECKKSEKPWVIFTSPKDGDDDNVFDYSDYDTINLGIPYWSEEKTWSVMDELIKISPLFNHPRHGRTYFVPFTNSETSEMIYKALTTSVKAAIAIKDNPGYGGRRICFYYPTIILQGRLFESYLENGETKLSEMDIVPVSFAYRSAKYDPVKFIVPIVTENALGKYLESLEQVISYWIELLRKNVKLPKKLD